MVPVGLVADRGGRYLTWSATRAAVGRVADTLLVLLLESGTLLRYSPAGADMIALAQYFAEGGLAGSVIAALYLRRFVKQARRIVHFDI